MTVSRAAGVLACALVAACSVSAITTSSAAQPAPSAALVVLRSSSSPTPPAHSLPLGAVPSASDVGLEVALKLPDPSAVTAFIASLSDRRSPDFHRFLTPDEFGQLFGPSSSEVSDVEEVLRSAGLDPGAVSPDRLLIPVRAPAPVIDRAFRVTLLRYRLPTGRIVFTASSPPSISASVSPYVEGVIGLSDLVQTRSLLVSAPPQHSPSSRAVREVHPRTDGPTPCAQAAYGPPAASGNLTADQLAAHYGMTPLYSLGAFGQGVHVAIAEFEADAPQRHRGLPELLWHPRHR